MEGRAVDEQIVPDEVVDLIRSPGSQAAAIQLSCDTRVSQELPPSLDGKPCAERVLSEVK